MFSNNVSLSDSLFISVFSIIAVFFILLMISFMIDLTVKALSLVKGSPESKKTAADPQPVAHDDSGEGVDPVTAAIIGSVIDSYMKDKDHEIKSIRLVKE